LYDFDRSGSISKDELTVLMTNVLTSIRILEKRPAPSIADIERKTNDFFAKADLNRDNAINLEEFKAYIRTDKQILAVLMRYGIAASDDLGTQFGTDSDGVPLLDPDLDNELKFMQNEVSDKKAKMKEGIDFNDGLDSGDQFMAVKPWKGTVDNMKPTGFKVTKFDG
jgi:hypothetical protein